MLTRVLGLDPGGTTGWVTYTAQMVPDPVDDEKVRFLGGTWEFGQLGPDAHHMELFGLLELMQTDNYHVVCESFEFRQKARDNVVLVSKEYIGVCNLWSQQNNMPVHYQTAAMAKGFITDDKIKKADLWVPGMKHSMDATRHALYYMVNKVRMYDILEMWK